MPRLKAIIFRIDDHWSGLSWRKILLEESSCKVLEATRRDEGLQLFFSPRLPHARDERRRGCHEDEAHQVARPDHAFVSLRTAVDEQAGFSGHLLIQIPTAEHSLVHASRFAGWPPTTFYRWLDHWKSRSQVATQ